MRSVLFVDKIYKAKTNKAFCTPHKKPSKTPHKVFQASLLNIKMMIV